MQDFENELVNVLDNASDQKTIINFVKSKLLESYRNGVTAGNKHFSRSPTQEPTVARRGSSGA
jgi:hypothetical protein